MTVVETMSTSSDLGSSGGLNPVVMKTGQEILTSLHLIKDIRRLEKYQREFFLKVKESLNHVQVLLDIQLMDMAWSDDLIDCEENLLKVSTHLQATSPSQLAELYSLLLHDREKLTARFHDLSVKSSLSEFVVNSRALLDLQSVQIAAEAILKNEKPTPARGDHSIPVDHTFFLANFCTASLASSMMASIVPKSATASSTSSSYSAQQSRSSSAYDAKKLNGSSSLQQQQQQLSNGSEISSDSHLRVVTPAKNGGRSSTDYVVSGSNVVMQQAASQMRSSGMQNIYDTDKNDLSNGMYRHEFASAISQIAQPRREEISSSSGGGKSAHRVNLVDRWGRPTDDSSMRLSSSTAAPPLAPPTSGVGKDMAMLANDVSSDDLSSTSEDATVNDVGLSASDGGKPLSFARIASLNLEKQQGMSLPTKPPSSNNSLPTLQSAIADRNMMTATPPSHHHAEVVAPIVSLPPSSNPRYFFDIVMDKCRMGRIIIEVEANAAPKMAANFHALVTAEKGYGYRNCQFFQVWKNESVICGDWEHNSGRGGKAALDEGSLFTPDDTKLPCIRGAVGMRRMSKKHSTLNEVASQFRIILTNMSNQFTGIFGHVVSNLEVIDRVANHGGEGGRPEKIAVVANCGIYKS